MKNDQNIRLTQYSHGAGCGCKISPKILNHILQSSLDSFTDKHLLVGHHNRDDAAVVDIGGGKTIISTADFFMPIVDDPFTFGQIAATNALSDVYAMGGKPIMAIAILGWPLDKLPPEVAGQVIDGGRSVCHRAKISLAGGHSIDAPEPIFGLAATGIADVAQIKTNDAACANDVLFLTKPLGVGILTTAQKQNKLAENHSSIAIDSMLKLNKIGTTLANFEGVSTMTDVTGFGLGGHLSEICNASQLRAEIDFSALPILPQVMHYLSMGCTPGGAKRNFDSFSHHLNQLTPEQEAIICDPQTSGGLLTSVKPASTHKFIDLCHKHGLDVSPIGTLAKPSTDAPLIMVKS